MNKKFSWYIVLCFGVFLFGMMLTQAQNNIRLGENDLTTVDGEVIGTVDGFLVGNEVTVTITIDEGNDYCMTASSAHTGSTEIADYFDPALYGDSLYSGSHPDLGAEGDCVKFDQYTFPAPTPRNTIYYAASADIFDPSINAGLPEITDGDTATMTITEGDRVSSDGAYWSISLTSDLTPELDGTYNAWCANFGTLVTESEYTVAIYSVEGAIANDILGEWDETSLDIISWLADPDVEFADSLNPDPYQLQYAMWLAVGVPSEDISERYTLGLINGEIRESVDADLVIAAQLVEQAIADIEAGYESPCGNGNGTSIIVLDPANGDQEIVMPIILPCTEEETEDTAAGGGEIERQAPVCTFTGKEPRIIEIPYSALESYLEAHPEARVIDGVEFTEEDCTLPPPPDVFLCILNVDAPYVIEIPEPEVEDFLSTNPDARVIDGVDFTFEDCSASPDPEYPICHVAGLASNPANGVIIDPSSNSYDAHFGDHGPNAGHEDDFFIITEEDRARCEAIKGDHENGNPHSRGDSPGNSGNAPGQNGNGSGNNDNNSSNAPDHSNANGSANGRDNRGG